MYWEPLSDALNIPKSYQRWLAITGSMTKALQDAAQSECHMNVQNESWQIPWTDELNDLPPMTTPYWIRETILIVKHPALFARAVFPKEFTEHFPDIFELGTRPLGQLIFTNNRFQRSNIRIAKMSGHASLSQKIPPTLKQNEYWARRSLFHSHLPPFLLTEVFFSYVATL
ncbi:MAG: chorismate lyase [Gammaproteobacteria bacterium]|nr:chorismate lyase [Gammaproteobacteria bacterium]MCD8543027.1 chorismate lyase [Gammaproteobacteria bacterium]